MAGSEVTGPEGDGSKGLVSAGNTMFRPSYSGGFLTNLTETTWLMSGSFSCMVSNRAGIDAEPHAGFKAAYRD